MAASDKDIYQIHAMLLAAGASRRFGDDNKLLVEIGGVPLVRRVAEQLAASRLAGVTVVTGFEADRLRTALIGFEAQFTDNPDFSEGLASSLRCGISAIPAEAAGAMIVLADMPGITTNLIDRLIGAFRQEDCGKIVYPSRAGEQGNPVIWPARYFEELQKLTGDAGAKRLIGVHEVNTVAVPVDDADAMRDIDRPGDISGWGNEGSS